MVTVNGPTGNVNLEVLEGSNQLYATPFYSGSSPKTDVEGRIAPITIAYEKYNSTGVYPIDSVVNYYYDSVEYSVDLDTSSTQDVEIWMNIRPEAIIDSFSALGDLASTPGIEGVKGADINITDSYTVAYWSFDEGQGTDVLDEVSSQPGKIRPTSIWNSGNSNLSSDYSLGFDGTFTIQASAGDILVVTFVSYETIEVTASNNMTVSMKPQVNSLGEIVITSNICKKLRATVASPPTGLLV